MPGDLQSASMGRHSAAPPEPSEQDRWANGLTVTLVILGALVGLGAIALWPKGDAPDLGIQPQTYRDATIVDSREDTCPNLMVEDPASRLDDCVIYTADLTSGPESGETITFQAPITQLDIPELHPGDQVVLLDVPSSPLRYTFIDYQRTTPLVWLALAFVVVVVAFGRWQGLRALAGLGLSLIVLVLFIVPALLRDSPGLLVALVGAAIVAYLAIYLAHGFNLPSSIALAGSLMSLTVTAGLAVIASSFAHLSGLVGSENAQTLSVTASALDLRGLLVAGIVIGSLGVLDDVTVSQVSTVAALRQANPDLSSRKLYSQAIGVGRDHVAAAVNTLVLAYAGAALPLLLVFAQGSLPLGRMLTGEVVAAEVVRMLVGSIGLILSVPITTALAALLLTRTGPPDERHLHLHTHSHSPAPSQLGDDRHELSYASHGSWPPPAANPRDPRAEPQHPHGPQPDGNGHSEIEPWF